MNLNDPLIAFLFGTIVGQVWLFINLIAPEYIEKIFTKKRGTPSP